MKSGTSLRAGGGGFFWGAMVPLLLTGTGSDLNWGVGHESSGNNV